MAAIAELALHGDTPLFQAAVGLCLALLPLATGAAILRYRLYDLDRIISRTVAWTLLTVLLGLGYAAVVLTVLAAQIHCAVRLVLSRPVVGRVE